MPREITQKIIIDINLSMMEWDIMDAVMNTTVQSLCYARQQNSILCYWWTVHSQPNTMPWDQEFITVRVCNSLASYPGRVGGEKQPGIDCLHMHDHSQKNLGIRLHLETVGKITTYTSDIFPYHRKIQPFASRITFNSINVEDNRGVYEAKDGFLRLPTSFGKSVRYEVLSFACLTVNKAS